MKLHLDFETRSAVDIKKVGLWAYAMHPSTDVTCMGWADPAVNREPIIYSGVNHGPRDGWRDGFAGRVVSAHNAHFEYAVYNLILHRRYGWPARWNPAWWSCTMARAAVCGLPLDLDALSRVLECKTPKDLEGRRIMLQLAKPIGVDPLGDPLFIEKRDAPDKYETLYAYNAIDVKAEMEVDEKLPELSPFERRVWELDLMMNRRGIQVDVGFARKAAGLANRIIVDLNTKLHTITCTQNGSCTPKTCDGVEKATQVQALKSFLKARYKLEVASLDKESVTTILQDPLVPAEAREILALRRQVGKKNSIAKYETALEMTCPDGRARGMFQYSAAHTRRWGGRGIQPQNMVKGPKAKKQAAIIEDVVTLSPAQFVEKYGDKALDALSEVGRGMFIAGEGKQLVVADFNAIEARVIFWLAGVVRALNAYARGESPYLDMARSIYPFANLPDKLTPAVKETQEYDIGKRTILGCGYGMGAETFRANIYSETAKTGKPVLISEELAQRAVKAYREKYPEIRSMWYEVERAAMNAVKDPTRAYFCCGGRVAWGMTKDRRFLACRLPSGEFLRYYKPSVKIKRTPWGEDKEALHYWGVNPDTKQWSELDTYGGALVENITQATARDLIANGMLNAQAAGYDVILTVHDEAGGEASIAGAGEWNAADTLADFSAKLCDVPAWAKGCPVAAEGFVDGRYHK